MNIWILIFFSGKRLDCDLKGIAVLVCRTGQWCKILWLQINMDINTTNTTTKKKILKNKTINITIFLTIFLSNQKKFKKNYIVIILLYTYDCKITTVIFMAVKPFILMESQFEDVFFLFSSFLYLALFWIIT